MPRTGRFAAYAGAINWRFKGLGGIDGMAENRNRKRMIVRMNFAKNPHKMGKFDEKKFLQFRGGYGILKSVVEEIGVNLL